MVGINVINGSSLLKKAQVLGAVVVASISVYGASYLWNSSSKHFEYKNRIESVENAINNFDNELASRLLVSFKEKNLLKPEDEARLELALERSKEVKEFNAAFDSRDFTNASSALEKIKSSNVVSADVVKTLEGKLDEFKEDKMFQNIVSTRGSKGIPLADPRANE